MGKMIWWIHTHTRVCVCVCVCVCDNWILLVSEVKYNFHSIFFIPLRKYCSELLRKNYYLCQFYNTIPPKNCQSMLKFQIYNTTNFDFLIPGMSEVRGGKRGWLFPSMLMGKQRVYFAPPTTFYTKTERYSVKWKTICFHILAHQCHNFKDSNTV